MGRTHPRTLRRRGPPTPEVPSDAISLSDGAVTVRVRRDFPQVIDYTVGHAHLAGRIGSPLTKVRINGTDRVATVSAPKTTDTSASWKLTFHDLPGVELTTHRRHSQPSRQHRVGAWPRPRLGHLN